MNPTDKSLDNPAWVLGKLHFLKPETDALDSAKDHFIRPPAIGIFYAGTYGARVITS